TIRLQRSPSASSVRLIGHPERCAPFIESILKNCLQYKSSMAKPQLLAYQNWLAKQGDDDDDQILWPSFLVLLHEGADRPVRERRSVRMARAVAGASGERDRDGGDVADP